MESYLTTDQVAEALGVAREKIHAWIASGELTGISITQDVNRRPRWRIRASEFERFLDSRSSKPQEPKTKRRRKANAKPAQREYIK